jgi:anti-sigma28 factor (negative regulator of flagellin synthesis)
MTTAARSTTIPTIDFVFDTWGVDPMQGLAACVDAVHAMTHTLQVSQHDHLAELVATASGRFGPRRVRTITWHAPDMEPVRTDLVLRMRARIESGEYQINERLVASAVVDRVCCGRRTITLH